MDIKVKKLGEKRIRGVIVALSFLVAFLLLIPLYQSVNSLIIAERDKFIQKFESDYNLTIQYDNSSRAVLSYFSLANIVVKSVEPSSFIHINISRLTISFNLFGLFRKNSSYLSVINSININRADIMIIDEEASIISQKDVENVVDSSDSSISLLIKHIFSQLESNEKNIIPPIVIGGKGINIEYKAPWGSIDSRESTVNLRPYADTTEVNISTDFTVRLHKLEPIMIPFVLSGRSSYSLDSGDLLFEIRAITSSYLMMGKQGLKVVWGNNRLEARKVIDRSPLDYLIRFDAEDGSFFSYFSAQKFRLSDFLSVNFEENNSLATALLGYFNGSGSVLYYPVSGITLYDLNGDFEVNLKKDIAKIFIDLAGNNLRAQVNELNIISGSSKVGFNGEIDLANYLPNGKFSASMLVKDQPLQITSRLINEGSYLKSETSEFTLGETNLGIISTIIAVEDLNYNLSASYQQPLGGSIKINGYYDLASMIGELRMMGNKVSLNSLTTYKLLPSVLTDSSLEWVAVGSKKGGDILIDINYFELARDQNHRLFTSLRVDQTSLSIDNLQLEWGDFALRSTLYSNLDEKKEFIGSFSNRAMIYPYTGSYADKILNVSYSYGSVAVDSASKTVNLRIDQMPLTRSDDPLMLNFLASVDYSKEPKALLSYLRLNNNLLSAQLSRGQFTQERGRLEQISYNDGISLLRGSADYAKRGNGNSYDAFLNISGDANELYKADLFYTDDLKGNVTLQNFPLERLGYGDMEGLASANIAINGIKDLQLNGNIDVKGYINNKRLELDGSFMYNPQSASISSLKSQYGAWTTKGGLFITDMNEQSVSFSSQVSKIDNSMMTGVGFYLKADDSGAGKSMGQFFSNDFSGVAQIDNLIVKGRNTISQSRIKIKKDSQMVFIDALQGMVGRASYNLEDKEVDLLISNKDGLSTEIKASLKPSSFFVNVSKLELPLPMLNPFLIFKERKRMIGFNKGVMRASFTIDSDRRMNGSISFNDGLLTSPFSPSTKLTLNNRINIENSVMSLDDSWKFMVNRSLLTLRARAVLAPELSYETSILIEKGNGAPFDFDIMNQLRFKGRMKGWAAFNGDKNTGYLTGRLTLPYAEGSLGSIIGTAVQAKEYDIEKDQRIGFNFITGINKEINDGYYNSGDSFIAAGKEMNSDTTGLFTLVTGESFTFYVPSAAIPTIVATAAEGQQANLMLDLTKNGEQISYMEADIKIARGEISYFGNTFTMKEGGLIQMNSLTSANPDLIFDASLKPDPAKSDVITMHFKNKVIDTYNPTFTSSTSMSNYDIMRTLGATFSPSLAIQDSNDSTEFIIERSESTTGFETIIKTTGDYAGEYLSRSIENVLRKFSFIDTVSIKTSFLSNFALATLGDTNSSNTAGVVIEPTRISVADYLNGSSIYAGSYLEQNLFVQASLGAEKSSSKSLYSTATGVVVPTIGLGFQFTTPLFLINWNLSSTFENGRVNSSGSKFNPEVSITLSKSFTFSSWSNFAKEFKESVGRE